MGGERARAAGLIQLRSGSGPGSGAVRPGCRRSVGVSPAVFPAWQPRRTAPLSCACGVDHRRHLLQICPVKTLLLPLVACMLALAGCQDSKRSSAGPALTNALPPAVSTPSTPYLTHAQPRLQTIKLYVGAEEVSTELAMKPVEIFTGMMWRTNMPEGEAMLFVFPSAEPRAFYMRNTPVPPSSRTSRGPSAPASSIPTPSPGASRGCKRQGGEFWHGHLLDGGARRSARAGVRPGLCRKVRPFPAGSIFQSQNTSFRSGGARGATRPTFHFARRCARNQFQISGSL